MKARVILAVLALLSGAAQAFPVNLPPSPVGQSILEYKNDITGHYVMLWDRTEIGLVEAGKLGPGWHRTGYVFGGFNVHASYVPPGNRMCRFYAPGPNSHFLTARTFECDGLKANPASGWIFERDDIVVYMPDNGSCGTSLPVYRLYNDRAAFNDTNHRHVADQAVRAQLVSEGWIDEGIAFCSAGYETPATEVTAQFFDATPPLAAGNPIGCWDDFRVSGAAVCLDVAGLAPMSTQIPRRIPPAFSQPNPQYPLSSDAVTGWNVNGGCINTALPASAGESIAQASFLQSLCTDSRVLGVHIRGTDGSSGAASVAEVYRFPNAPAADGSDRRFFQWATKAHVMTLTVEAIVKTVANGFAGGKAQGEGILLFHDGSSGHDLSISYRIYDTNPAADSIRYDAETATTRIVTAFSGTPLVGELLHGNFIACSGPDCHQGLTAFQMRITREEFAAAVALARQADAKLSADPANYMMTSFQMRNETTRDGELGVEIGNIRLTTGVLALDLPP